MGSFICLIKARIAPEATRESVPAPHFSLMFRPFRPALFAGSLLLATFSARPAAEPDAPAAPHPTPENPLPGRTAYHSPPRAFRPSLPAADLEQAVLAMYDAWKRRYLVMGSPPGQAYIFANREGRTGNKEALTV